MSSTSLIDARAHRLRLIVPTSVRDPEGATQTLLGKTYGFTELPVSHLPTSHDLVEGSYTRRLGDSGEFSLSFPNVAGSKGLWRELFDPDLSLQFIEIYRDDVLEFVGSVQRVEIDRDSVTVSGPDAWGLLRRAYESDRSWTNAPRDVVETYTRVPVSVLADDFDGASLAAGWSTGSNMTATVANGEVTLKSTNLCLNPNPAIIYDVGVLSDTWRLVAVAKTTPLAPSTGHFVYIEVADPTIASYAAMLVSIQQVGAYADVRVGGPVVDIARVRPPSSAVTWPATLILERLGRWVRAFVGGELIGILPWTGTLDAEQVSIGGATFDDLTDEVIFEQVNVTDLRSFLARGSDVGDYVLPGDYPTGGLRGRYWNNADLAGLTAAERRYRLFTPDRDPYAERLDAVIDTTGSSAGTLSTPVKPGSGDEYYSVRWFGAIYLRLDLGNYVFETTSVDDGARLWVGKTDWGDELIDSWDTGGTTAGTLTASTLGSEAGWYPIVVEFYNDQGSDTIRLQFTPPGTTYTDPGGGTITASTKTVIPKTSLSPLGCYDNRVQGRPHFDMVQEAAAAFGYDITCEPMQLESGEFPGRLVPRERVGTDTDVVLEVEDTDAAEPILSPGVTLDGSDQATTLRGGGAGLPDGRGSQVTGEVSDLSQVTSSLFDLTQHVDAADISFADLLGARLEAELALRGSPWEEVRGTPRAQERLADTWPLSDTLSAMRWRPGDGVRLRLPDIGVEDASPRQILQVTRAFAAEGRTGTQVAFRQRPRSAGRSVRRLLQAALQPQRAYQRQKVTLPSQRVDADPLTAAAFSDYIIVSLQAGDHVVKAELRITRNTAAQGLGVEINGTDRTTALGGGWSTVPVIVDITGYATQASSTDNRFYVRIQNNGGSQTAAEFHVVVEVLR